MASVPEGFVIRPEWAIHKQCWMAWPGEVERDTWEGRLEEARAVYARVARAIRCFEPVTLACAPSDGAQARALCGPEIDIVPLQYHESWIRDTGPSFLSDNTGKKAAVSWQFNDWGMDPVPSSYISQGLISLLDLQDDYHAPLIVEGGAFSVDGRGTLMAVEACLLERNPSLTKAEIETILLSYSGCTRLIWLGQGYQGDDTGGHIDAIACFIRPGTVLTLSCDDPADDNYVRCRDNLTRLQKAKTAANTGLEVVTISAPPPQYRQNKRLTLSYINYYIANGGLIMPMFNSPDADEEAFGILSLLYPERQIVPLPVLDIVRGGGGIHCITLAEPE